MILVHGNICKSLNIYKQLLHYFPLCLLKVPREMNQRTTKPAISLVRPAKHPRSLNKVFADRMCFLQLLGYPKRDKREPLPY